MATRTTAADNPMVSRMDQNVPPDGTAFHFPVEPSEALREGPPREDEELALLWGTTPKAAHTLKTHAARRAADVIRLRRAKGDTAAACRYALPIEEAMAGAPCPDALHREMMTDAQEDVAQEHHRVTQTPESFKALLRIRAANRQAMLDHDREEAKKWEVTL